MNAMISQHIFELRYKPCPLLLDNKGFLLNILSKEFKLEQMIIQENGVIVQNEDTKITISVSIDRIGIAFKNIDRVENYESYIIKLLTILQATNFFGDKLFVNRIGVRIRACYEHKSTFDSLKDMFLKNYLTINPNVIDTLKLELKDVGYPIVFKDKEATINTNCGPMRHEEIKNSFNDFLIISDVKIPKVGLYADVDYYWIPLKILKYEELTTIISEYSKKSQEKIEIIKNIILGNKNNGK